MSHSTATGKFHPRSSVVASDRPYSATSNLWATSQILIGTWANASWAITFCRRNSFICSPATRRATAQKILVNPGATD